MTEKLLTPEEIKELKKNPYVKSVSEKTVTYTDAFREYFIQEWLQGKGPTQIMRMAGFDPKVLGKDRVHSAAKHWKKAYERPDGLKDLRKGHVGRKATKDLSPEEEIQRLKQKVKYLEQENAFLKKIEFIDKKAERQRQRRKKNTRSSKK